MKKLEPDTEIELTLAIGGVRAAAKFTVVEPMTIEKLKELAAKRAPGLADDVFDAFLDGFAKGFIAKTVDGDDDA